MKSWLFLIMLLTAVGGRAAQDAETADETFARAARLADSNLTQSREIYRVAALRFLEQARAHPASRGPLLYNAGNAFFLAGNPGRAIVSYRRAEPYMPGSSLLRDNLRFVRKQSGNPEEPLSQAQFAMLRFWSWNPAVQWVVLAGAVLLFWVGLFWRQWSGRDWSPRLMGGTLGVAVLMAGTMLLVHMHNTRRCRGVLVASQVVARKGPNYGYTPAFTAPLDAGIECNVTDRQGDWLHVTLDDKRECWVRTTAVEIWQGTIPGK